MSKIGRVVRTTYDMIHKPHINWVKRSRNFVGGGLAQGELVSPSVVGKEEEWKCDRRNIIINYGIETGLQIMYEKV